MRRLALLLVWTLPSAVFLAVTAVVYFAYRIPPPDRLDDDTRAAVMATLRAAMMSNAAGRRPVASMAVAIRGPVVVSVWSGGRAIVRIEHPADGDDLEATVRSIAVALHDHPGLGPIAAADREAARIQVDVITGTAPLGANHWLLGLFDLGVGDMAAINSGVEGIGDATGVVLPHELIAAKLLAARKPTEAVADFAIGVDVARIRSLLAQRANRSVGVATQLFRFRTDTFIERPLADRTRPPLRLYRGVPEPPMLTASVLREHALAGGRYLVAHLAPNGRYVYEHDVSTGTMTDPKRGAYSMPRHAGTTYFLAELYRITKQPWLREPIERAFAHLADLMRNGRCANTSPDGTPIDCVIDSTETIATLGSTALAVVAFAEYQRATGDKRYLAIATKLAAWIQWMQRDDGSFRHRYDPATKRADDEAQDLYFSGEAALALARMHAVTGDPKYAAAAERGLDWLVGWYDFFLGGFFYGEEHWTCIAAEAIWPAVQKPAYRDFCHGYGAFLRQQQPELGEHPDEDDLVGSYGFTPFLAPYNTPAGSRTEAMISAYLLGRYHGTPDPDVRDQVRAALQYVVGQQIVPDDDFAVVGPGLGGIPESAIARTVRIDYVQHVCSALIRASEWIDD